MPEPLDDFFPNDGHHFLTAADHEQEQQSPANSNGEGDAEAAATAAAAPEPEAGPEAEAAPPSFDPEVWEQALALAEAVAFAADRPVTPKQLQPLLPEGLPAAAVFAKLAERCQSRPVRLIEVAGGWAFRTAPDLAPAITRVVEVPRRLPRVAMETLSIIAYHQPVTRSEIEEIRGASLSQNTLEALLDMGLVAPRGRKEVPGRPSLWGTTPKFLEQFGLKQLSDLPRREELVNDMGPPLPLNEAKAEAEAASEEGEPEASPEAA